ncbi:HEAT repeat domain-containing protein [Pseudoduganella sp. GCM10020061]|uniref:HEAT repeat domain-containing protein n=1 Tax=Pseudoduganella sp. GCM10020061 TaxID=3317345 RepID=UPI003644643E
MAVPSADPVLLAAWWTGLGAFALTLALALSILALRVALLRSQRRYQRVVEVWRPVLAAAIAGDAPGELPVLTAKRMRPFLKLWIHLHASLRGGATEQLNELARRLGCDAYARKLLASGRRGDVLLAILVLGYMRDAAAFGALERKLHSASGVVSINAAWALMQAAPERAAQAVVDAALARPDWAQSRVVLILCDGGPAVAQALVSRLEGLDTAQLPGALRLAEGIRAVLPVALHRRLLAQGDEAVLVAALRLVNDPALLPELRLLARHPQWRVRLHAARALGRTGAPEDAPLLVSLLADREWWVRLRAAEALAASPYLDMATIEHMAAQTGDRYAIDMLRQVAAQGVAP